MKRLVVAIVFVCALVASCVRQPIAPPDRTLARAAILQMGVGVHAAAEQCTAHGQWLLRFGAEEESARLFNGCVRRLIPARDAVTFAPEQVDPWTPRSSAVVGCTGKAVRVALEELHGDFVAFRVREPPAMTDAVHAARWAETFALPSCDPLHPTTSTAMYEPPTVPRIDP